MTSLISYTLPCHKREADLVTVLPSVIVAANASPPVDIVIVDYGHPGTLVKTVWGFLKSCAEGVTLRTVRVEREHFHMAHARNVGIQRAQGEIVVAFLADQLVTPEFFSWAREHLKPGTFLQWIQTFVFHRADIHAAGGFDERFEFYGPEGKELADRLVRRGLTPLEIPDRFVNQIPTAWNAKFEHYRRPDPGRGRLTRREMHHMGMELWRENQAHDVTIANQGKDWGVVA